MKRATTTLLATLFVWFACAAPARADTIQNPITISDPDGTSVTLQPAVDAAGNSIYELFDLSPDQEWTTASNLALTSNLLNLILDLGGDSSMIAQLFQTGGALAQAQDPDTAVVQVVAGAGSQDSPAEPGGSVPEPGTLGLLGAALACFVVFAFFALGRARAIMAERAICPEPQKPWADTTN